MLWQLTGERPVSHAAREAITAAEDTLIGTVSFAEIGIKVSLHKFKVPPELE